MHYIDDPRVKRQVDLFDLNNERLFNKLEAPDFELEYPETLTKEVYLSILKKVFATIRYRIYKQIRDIIRPREQKYLTKNELKDILHNLNVQEIRAKAFQLYGLPEPSPRFPSHRTLQKAHYTYMIDKDFMNTIRQVKQSHERFMTAILACDVYPALEKTDPLSSQEEDHIPPKFGPRWFEEEVKEEEESKEGTHTQLEDEKEQKKFGQIIMDKDELDVNQLSEHIDS